MTHVTWPDKDFDSYQKSVAWDSIRPAEVYYNAKEDLLGSREELFQMCKDLLSIKKFTLPLFLRFEEYDKKSKKKDKKKLLREEIPKKIISLHVTSPEEFDKLYNEAERRSVGKEGNKFIWLNVNLKTHVTQTNGQLMGHPLSFVLLCMANKLVYQRFADVCQIPDECRGCLVNGDDMIFLAPPGLRDKFLEISGSIGFQESFGKNYESKRFGMINNKIFKKSIREGEMVVEEVGFMNCKIVAGFSLKTGESQATPDAVGREITRMSTLAPFTLGILP
jgi:hypothetical protein